MSLNVIKCQKMSENVTEMSQKGFLTKACKRKTTSRESEVGGVRDG